MILYSIILAEFVIRYYKRAPVAPFRLRPTQQVVPVPAGSIPFAAENKARKLIAAMITSTILIFIRSVFRSVELLDGWTGPIESNEALFTGLDGLMVFLAVLVFNVVHPMWFFPSEADLGNYDGTALGTMQGSKSELVE